jgi:hypothetical protein
MNHCKKKDNMPKYTLAIGQAKESVLEIDGLQSVCPFIPAIPIQGNVGQIQLMRLPCNTLCPHASTNGETYIMTCSGNSLTFKLDKKEEEPKLESKVIHLS